MVRTVWRLHHSSVVLEKILESGSITDPDLSLAIRFVLGKGVDWDFRLKGWFDDASREA